MLKLFALATLVRLLAAVGSYVFAVVAANVLGAKQYGYVSICLVVITGLSLVGRRGLDNYLMRFAGCLWVDSKDDFFSLVSNVLSFITKNVLVILLVLFSFLYLFDLFFEWTDPYFYLVVLSALIILPFSVANALSSVLKASQKPSFSPFLENGGVMLLAGSMLYIAHSFFDFSITAEFVLLVFLVSILFIFIVFYIKSSVVRKALLLCFSRKFENVDINFDSANQYFQTSLATFVIQWSSSFLIVFFVSSQEVGLLSLTQRLAYSVSFALMVMNSIIPPLVATKFKNGDMLGLEKVLKKSMVFTSLIALPIVVFFLFFGSGLLDLIGSDYQSGYAYLVAFSVTQFINVLTGSVGLALNMTGYEKTMKTIVLFSGSVSIIVCLSSASFIGAWSAVLAFSSGVLIQNLSSAWVVYKKLNINIFSFKLQHGESKLTGLGT